MCCLLFVASFNLGHFIASASSFIIIITVINIITVQQQLQQDDR